ncbi:hypothetical protein Vadar_020502 [Vaccinium darrowii]|uniref:Uncharacterized protein n=1 Tax=Vaccinium darrowii TaxID=229202 RepID=A0ACB7ZLT8_9ERIC|nr:hypothetical protein Vadar_020502 [Vaccinium darrowii]
MAEEVKLLGFGGSPFSCRVEIALKLKGIQYEMIPQELANKSPLLLEHNPVHKKIPVLLHHGKPICESVVILEYVEETWKGVPLLPEDPYERAMARFWAKFIDEKCLSTVWKACFSKGEEQEKGMEEVLGLLKTLESQLEGKKFFGGDNIGFLDIVADFAALWLGVLLEVAGVDLLNDSKLPLLCKWIEEFNNCPVVKETLPPRDMLLKFFKMQQAATGPQYK